MSGKNNQILSKPLFKLLILFNIMVFILFLSVLYDSFSGQVRHQQALVENFAHSMKLRIDTYRFATWQIYQDQTTGSDNDPTSNPLAGESRLRSDVYAPNGDEDKTHVLIFGAHNQATLANASNAADFLDTLWGIKTNTWSMYYLNGQDNSLTMVSTLPLKDMISRYNGERLTGLISTRRAEMLQQANTLDERESFSELRHTPDSNDYYFTLRTTFNQPGHLANVLAFDLPVNDMLIGGLQPQRLVFHDIDNSGSTAPVSSRLNLANASVGLEVAVPSSSLIVSYQVSVMMLLSQSLHDFSLSLSLCLLLLLLSMTAVLLLRQTQAPEKENAQPGAGPVETSQQRDGRQSTSRLCDL